MAFIPKNWANDQTVYAEDMNRIEQGIVQEPTRQIEIHDEAPDAHPALRTAIQEVQDAQPIISTAPPTTSTVGVVGQEYIDKTNKRVWYCTAAESTGHTWILTSAGLSTKVNTTLSASGWSTEKKYTVSNANITATSAVELLPR